MDRTEDVERLFRTSYADLVRFAARRCSADRAEDVAAEVFIVACRRIDDLPSEADAARAWLFGIARRLLLAEQRGYARGRALRIRLEQQPLYPAPGPEEGTVARAELAAGWERLKPEHQEALALTALDGLSGPEAARVLGITAVAFRLRLMRARRALAGHLRLPPSASSTRSHARALPEGTS